MFSIFQDPMFVSGLFIGCIFALVIVAIILLWIVIDPAEGLNDIEKTPKALRHHKKERKRADQQAVSCATMMVCDGSLDMPKR